MSAAVTHARGLPLFQSTALCGAEAPKSDGNRRKVDCPLCIEILGSPERFEEACDEAEAAYARLDEEARTVLRRRFDAENDDVFLAVAMPVLERDLLKGAAAGVVEVALEQTLAARPPALLRYAPVETWLAELRLPLDDPKLLDALWPALGSAVAAGRVETAVDEFDEPFWRLAPAPEPAPREES